MKPTYSGPMPDTATHLDPRLGIYFHVPEGDHFDGCAWEWTMLNDQWVWAQTKWGQSYQDSLIRLVPQKLYTSLDEVEQLKQQLSMAKARWTSFADAWPLTDQALDDPNVSMARKVLLTNNINAQDRFGRSSHVWYGYPNKREDGTIYAYTEDHLPIENVTHWYDPFGEIGCPEHRYVTVTCRDGKAVLVSWQDEEHRIIQTIWEAGDHSEPPTLTDVVIPSEQQKRDFNALYKISPQLEAVIGPGPVKRLEVTKQVWDYIKKHDLQSQQNRRMIIPDAALSAVLGSEKPISMFELTGLLSSHLKLI